MATACNRSFRRQHPFEDTGAKPVLSISWEDRPVAGNATAGKHKGTNERGERAGMKKTSIAIVRRPQLKTNGKANHRQGQGRATQGACESCHVEHRFSTRHQVLEVNAQPTH